MSIVEVSSTNIEQIEKRLRAMREKAPRVLKLAVNDTARKARSRLAKEAKKKYLVKVSGINHDAKITFATNSNHVATIRYQGRKIPLYKFSHRAGSLGTEKYYNPTLHTWQVGKGGIGAVGKRLKGTRWESGEHGKLKWFIVKMSSGHTGIFQRNEGVKRGEGSKKKPEIKQIMGASIPEMIGDEKRVYGIVEPHIQSDLEKAVERHIMRALKGQM